MDKLKTRTGKPMTRKQLWARRRNWELKSLRWILHELDFRFQCRCSEVKVEGHEPVRSATLSRTELDKYKKAIELLRSLIDNWSIEHHKLKHKIDFSKFV